MKVGLIGAGGIGEAHSSAYGMLPGVNITAVVDVRPERAAEIAEAHSARAYTSTEEMLAVESLDMVDVCTPSFTHTQIALSCMENGLHVLCEKPIAMNTADARRMVDKARQKNLKFMIAQVIRFWPEYLFLKKLLDEKTYGELLDISFSRTSGAPIWSWEGWYVDPECSGRAPFELGIHDIDFINYLLGKPESVQAYGIEKMELLFSSLRASYLYPGGLAVNTLAAWYAGNLPFSATYRAVFRDAVLEYASDQLLLYLAGNAEGIKIEAGPQVELSTKINLENAGPIYNEIAYFVECVRTDRFPQVITPEDSLISLGMLLAALESSKTGELVSV